jgi:hypothetical protein
MRAANTGTKPMIIQRFSAAGIAALAGLVPGSAALAASSNISTAHGSATGIVVTTIVLTHVSGATLNFGSFTVGTGGKVDVTPKSVATVTKDVAFVPGTASPAADQFTLTGVKKTSFTIATTAGSVTNGIATMTFTTTPSAGGDIIDAGGNYSFTVGGKLTVAGTETPGTYTGSYTATVAYD